METSRAIRDPFDVLVTLVVGWIHDHEVHASGYQSVTYHFVRGCECKVIQPCLLLQMVYIVFDPVFTFNTLFTRKSTVYPVMVF